MCSYHNYTAQKDLLKRIVHFCEESTKLCILHNYCFKPILDHFEHHGHFWNRWKGRGGHFFKCRRPKPKNLNCSQNMHLNKKCAGYSSKRSFTKVLNCNFRTFGSKDILRESSLLAIFHQNV